MSSKTKFTLKLIEILREKYGRFKWAPRYDPISELIYTILSQHTSDTNSDRAFKKLRANFGSLENVAEASLGEIEDSIRTAGLYRIKSSRIKLILLQIQKDVGSLDLGFLKNMKLKDAKSWLTKLDGIGPKTAAIVLCFSFGMPAMPVDTHIYRVSKRLGLIKPKVTAEQAHDILESIVPPKNVFEFLMQLINHGRSICKAINPRCDNCTLEKVCPSRNKFI